jgi:integrase
LCFSGFADFWVKTHVKPNNRPSQVVAKESSLTVHLLPYFKHQDIREIDSLAAERFKAALLDKGLSRASVNRHVGHLRAMLRKAEEWGYIAKAPRIHDLRVERPDRDFFSIPERDKFLAECRERRPEWYAYFVTSFHTGMRAGELAALRWDDVDFFGRAIRVRRSVWRGHELLPKGRRARTVPMNSAVHDALRSHRHLADDHVFLNGAGKPLDCNGGYKVFKTLCRLAGLRTLRRHDIRHSFASNLVGATGNLLACKDILGHVDLKTTLIYSHLLPRQHADAVEALVTGASEAKGLASTRSS